MTNGGSSLLPDRLPAVTDRWHGWLRLAWFGVLALTLLLDIAGTMFVMRDAFVHDPSFLRLGLISTIENDGTVTVKSRPHSDGRPAELPEGTRVLAIDGAALPADTPIWGVAARLERPEGAQVNLAVRKPDGATAVLAFVSRAANLRESGIADVVSRDVRIGLRLALAVTTCLTLIACAVLLFVRRSRDPVALLLSFSFLIFAGSIDPPLNMWLAIGLGWLYDPYASFGWVLLVVALATFPDGRFVPRSFRWVLVIAPLAAIPLSIDETPPLVNSLIAFIAPLALITSHVIKYRRFEPGIERQQLKWAAFGFAAGLTLLAIAFLAAPFLPSTGPSVPLISLGVVFLFNLGFMSMALGLLVSLIRFRLWEADGLINRTAVSATVTLMVGVIWALSTDLVKRVVEHAVGPGQETAATVAGALLAAGIFAPTQTLALRWAKRRFNRERDRVRKLVSRLGAWRASETPEEIALRTLSALAAAIHSSSSAILVDTNRGRKLLAARDIDDVSPLLASGFDPSRDTRFRQVLPLEDEDGPIGQLLLGPRSDFNRYNANELHCLREVTEPLAETLRAAIKRVQQADSMQAVLGAVEERLSRLEGGGPMMPRPA
jgi:hypothetical protein